MLGLESSYLESSIFGLIADQDEEDLKFYDESIVTSVLETNDCDDMIIDCDKDDDDDEFDFDTNWDDVEDIEDELLDDIESTPIYDEFDSDYRTYY
ncbi:MAG: hypothetical protein ACLR5O_01765 [Romboutsia timonensis]|uniref:hypothetical protein n=1 Tax=Romboutsia timonensis TaxID=1776391 RepID=UPI0039A3EA0A